MAPKAFILGIGISWMKPQWSASNLDGLIAGADVALSILLTAYNTVLALIVSLVAECHCCQWQGIVHGNGQGGIGAPYENCHISIDGRHNLLHLIVPCW